MALASSTKRTPRQSKIGASLLHTKYTIRDNVSVAACRTSNFRCWSEKHQTTKTVLCAAGDGNAYEWDLESLPAAGIGDKDSGVPVRTYEGSKGYLHAVAVSNNSMYIQDSRSDLVDDSTVSGGGILMYWYNHESTLSTSAGVD